ncbi:hypothetical protein ABB37_05635 [Leptomonas pyrrhocoris]|uniref:PCI domain-containing protein n=1 Tax=Leptomonas pyrrhocoris TaxID=157538 RepID=A0A0N0DUN3_LEPPY|nr:hypothetical protein ABB37_05635 [Leptomonas pyrrhocoris]KPA79122.1 hypothetical protein ABB37_05635 [Leptomonas pyrrhocoris]|eukprot:XP_015657561.1 hypothetical protein ABB37_05635 [Leptomonas pyrrhocoris]
MFTFNAFGGAAPPVKPISDGGVLGAPALPVYSSHSDVNAVPPPPVFGGAGLRHISHHGTAVPLAATPVFGGAGSGGGNAFTARSAGILYSSGAAAGAEATGAPSTLSSGEGVPAPPPPVYSAAVPAAAVPVFGGGRSFGSVPSFTAYTNNNNRHNSSSDANRQGGVLGGNGALPMPQNPPTTSQPGPSDGNPNSSSVFGSAAPRLNSSIIVSSTSTDASMPPPPHLKFDFSAPSSTSVGHAATSFTAHPGNALGAAHSGSVLLTDSTRTNAAVKSSGHSTPGPVLASAFSGEGNAATAPPPFSSSASFSPPLSSFALSSHSLPLVVAVEKSVGRGGYDSGTGDGAGGGATPAFSSSTSSFSAPFGRTAKPAALTGDAKGQAEPSSLAAVLPSRAPFATPTPPSQLSSGFPTAATKTTPLPINTSDTGSGILGSVTPSGTAPPTTAFGATVIPTSPQPSASSSATFRAAATAARPPQVPSPAFSADNAPPVGKRSSAFVPETGDAKPNTGTTSAFAAFAGAASATSSVPAKSAFGSSSVAPAPSPQAFHTAPPATGASDGHHRPAGGSAFAAAASSSSPSFSGLGGRGGAGASGDGRGDYRGRGRGGGHGRDRHDRRRDRSPSPSRTTEEGRFHADSRGAPPPTFSAQSSHFSIPAPRHVQQQQQQQQMQMQPTAVSRLEKLTLPSLPSDEKQWSLAARVCKSFLLQVASPAATTMSATSAGRETGAAEALEQAFFGVAGREGVTGDFGTSAGEMLAVWQTQVRPMLTNATAPGSAPLPFPGEMWVALFALGAYLNVILSTLASPDNSSRTSTRADLAVYKAGLRDHPVEALTDACHYANEMSELLQTIFQRGGEAAAPPYSVLPVVLRRVRTVFDAANARGVATVQSNWSAVTSKLFAVLNRRVKSATVQVLPSTNGATDKPPRWLLTFDSTEKESLLHSFAYLVSEMIAVDAPMNEDVELFMAAFHECLPSALAERCMLYYRRACALLRQPLGMRQMEEAAKLLARALAVYPPDAPPNNRRVLEVKLLTAELALGRLPSDKDRIALDVPQLVDVVNALKTSRLDLLDAALKMHGRFFVQIGVQNALMLARQRVALLMVVKFYVTHGCENRLRVTDMVRYHRLPYSGAEAGMVWLLPLLVGKDMNGVLDHDYLILSGKAPFDAYPRELLAAAAGLL